MELKQTTYEVDNGVAVVTLSRPEHMNAFTVRMMEEMLEIFAKGPVVVTSRVDTVKAPGKPDQVYKIAGVFIVKGGKITEWTDFLDA